MALMDHILPANGTLYERTLASNVDRLLELDIDRLRRLWDPYRCHIDDLPFLAWALSVDIWDTNWDETKKRNVVANAVNHHRIKGTEAGIATYLELVDARLNELVTPPARGYRIPGFSPEEFQFWLSRLPQIRVYPFVTRSAAGPRDFRKKVVCFRSDNFREPSIGKNIYGKRATLYQNGTEQTIRIEQMEGLGAQAVQRVFFAGVVKRDFHSNGFRGDQFREKTTAASNIVTVRIADGSSARSSVTPGLTPQDVRPVQVFERHVPRPAQHFRDYNKSFRGENFRQQTDAPLWIYDEISLHSRDNLPTALHSKWYRGHIRYGIADFTAEATVEVPLTRSPALGFGGRFRNGFRMKTDMTKLDDACGAIVAAKPLRDTVLVNTVTHRVVRLKDKKKLGSFKLGEIIRVA